jgi:hypothetical protein
MKDNDAPSFNELTPEDIARSWERKRQYEAAKKAAAKSSTPQPKSAELNGFVKWALIGFGGFIALGIASILISAPSLETTKTKTPTITPSAEVVKTEPPTKCEALRNDLLSAADDVARYYASTVGGNSDEYYALRSKADDLKQQMLDANCPGDPEQIRY